MHGHTNNQSIYTFFFNYFRWLSNKECRGYQYKETKEATCMLIYKNCGGADGQVFQQNDNSHIYEKGLLFGNKLVYCSRWPKLYHNPTYKFMKEESKTILFVFKEMYFEIWNCHWFVHIFLIINLDSLIKTIHLKWTS